MKNETINNVGIYVRVSTQEQAKEGYSIPTQIKLLESFCVSQGWSRFEVYSDMGLSAKDTNRPALQQLQEDIKQRKIDVLLVYRLDRLTRSVRDLFDLLQFLEENECAFKSATENYDTTTAMGRMFIGLVGLLAQWERENLGERVSVAMKEKVISKLESSGSQPYGYKVVNKKRVIKEDERDNVVLIVELFKQFGSASKVAKELNARGIGGTRNGKPWRHQMVRQILQNPAICGDMYFDGEVAKDAFEPIVSREDFETIGRRLEKQSKVRLKAATSGIFSGVLQCPQCDRILVKHEGGYRCNACPEQGRPFMRVAESSFMMGFLKYIRHYKVLEIPTPSNVKKFRDYDKELRVLERKREKLQRMYTDDFMTYQEFTEQMKENKLLIKQLEDEKKSDTEFPINEEVARELMWQMVEHFEELTKDERKEFVSRFIDRIHFSRVVAKYDKNDVPMAYEYIINGVVFNQS